MTSRHTGSFSEGLVLCQCGLQCVTARFVNPYPEYS